MSLKDGPGEGTWAVFAEQVVAERDDARARISHLLAENSRLAGAKQAAEILVTELSDRVDALEEELRGQEGVFVFKIAALHDTQRAELDARNALIASLTEDTQQLVRKLDAAERLAAMRLAEQHDLRQKVEDAQKESESALDARDTAVAKNAAFFNQNTRLRRALGFVAADIGQVAAELASGEGAWVDDLPTMLRNAALKAQVALSEEVPQ